MTNDTSIITIYELTIKETNGNESIRALDTQHPSVGLIIVKNVTYFSSTVFVFSFLATGVVG